MKFCKKCNKRLIKSQIDFCSQDCRYHDGKVCQTCNEKFSINCFYIKRLNKNGQPCYNPDCIECRTSKDRKHYGKISREQVLKRQRELYNTPNKRYTAYKTQSKRRKIDFALSKEEFLSFWQKNCYYCDSEIKTIGLDRVDSSRGYILHNVVSCCKICNYMKLELTLEQWMHHIKKILAHIEQHDVKDMIRN